MSITDRLKPTLDDWFTKCDPFYGVCIDEYSGRVEIVCVGVNCVDKKLFDVYDSVDELPKWLQDKIAILMGCKDGDAIDTVGRKIDALTFWIFGDEQ